MRRLVVRSVLVACVVLVGVAAFVFVTTDWYAGSSSRTNDALLMEQAIAVAVRGHYDRNGRHPESLDEVAPLLTNGPAAILDPWGRPFEFAVTDDGHVSVWTTRPDGVVIRWPRTNR